MDKKQKSQGSRAKANRELRTIRIRTGIGVGGMGESQRPNKNLYIYISAGAQGAIRLLGGPWVLVRETQSDRGSRGMQGTADIGGGVVGCC